MKIKLTAFVIAAASTIAASFVAWADETKKDLASQEKIFKILDANHDGRVTEKEFVITGLQSCQTRHFSHRYHCTFCCADPGTAVSVFV